MVKISISLLESGEGSLVESPEIVELDDVGFHADAEDESFGIESGDGARREIHEPLTIVAAEIPQPKGGIQRSRNEEIVGRRHGQTGDSVRVPRKVTVNRGKEGDMACSAL